jgi:predicted nucleotidyltransferase
MIDNRQIEEILSKVRRYSAELFGDSLESVILFGSYARGDFDDESDIDIMIIVDMDARELSPYKYEFAHFGTALDLEYEIFHSFTLQDKKTFEYWKDIIPFYKNVLAEGVTASA